MSPFRRKKVYGGEIEYRQAPSHYWRRAHGPPLVLWDSFWQSPQYLINQQTSCAITASGRSVSGYLLQQKTLLNTPERYCDNRVFYHTSYAFHSRNTDHHRENTRASKSANFPWPLFGPLGFGPNPVRIGIIHNICQVQKPGKKFSPKTAFLDTLYRGASNLFLYAMLGFDHRIGHPSRWRPG